MSIWTLCDIAQKLKMCEIKWTAIFIQDQDDDAADACSQKPPKRKSWCLHIKLTFSFKFFSENEQPILPIRFLINQIVFE